VCQFAKQAAGERPDGEKASVHQSDSGLVLGTWSGPHNFLAKPAREAKQRGCDEHANDHARTVLDVFHTPSLYQEGSLSDFLFFVNVCANASFSSRGIRFIATSLFKARDKFLQSSE
jgi:hypothetical protein